MTALWILVVLLAIYSAWETWRAHVYRSWWLRDQRFISNESSRQLDWVERNWKYLSANPPKEER